MRSWRPGECLTVLRCTARNRPPLLTDRLCFGLVFRGYFCHRRAEQHAAELWDLLRAPYPWQPQGTRTEAVPPGQRIVFGEWCVLYPKRWILY